MFAKAFGKTVQEPIGEAPETPSKVWKGFSFGDYRSPAALSNGSATPSPLQQAFQSAQNENAPVTAKHNKRLSGDARQRRDPRKRFSFLMSEQDFVKARGRPSLLTLDEDEETDSAVTGGDKPTSIQEHVGSQSMKPSVPHRPLQGNTARQRQRSSRLSESVYFDAEEGATKNEALDAISEEADVECQQAQQSTRQKRDQVPNFEMVEEENLDDTNITLDESEEDSEDESDEDDEDDGSILVMRDSTSSCRTQRKRRPDLYDRIPCTPATTEDTERCKSLAMSLLRYDESEDMYAALMERLERMIKLEQTAAFRATRRPLTVSQLAKTLKNFLRGIAVGRVQTGEHRKFVEHEMEWAGWIYGACKTGVMHVKTRECRCRTEWKLE